MNQTQQKLQEVFGKIDEIAAYFITKMEEKDESLNLVCTEKSLNEQVFLFSLSDDDKWSTFYFTFPLESLDLAPAALYKSWKLEKDAKVKANKQLTKEINQLKRVYAVKRYLQLTEESF